MSGESEDSRVSFENVDASTSERIPRPLPGTAWIARPFIRLQQLVLAIAEQDEVQLEEPVEELRDLLDDLR